MATKNKNLSKIDGAMPSAESMSFGIVVAEWNPEITGALLQGAIDTLLSAGCLEENIVVKHVPGTFELPLGAKYLIINSDVDAVITLGCVIQGDTRHFDYVCGGVTQGVMSLQLEWDTPVAFGVLTVDNMQQALDRAGGEHGNKGVEAAATAIKMVALREEIIAEYDNDVDEEAFDKMFNEAFADNDEEEEIYS